MKIAYLANVRIPSERAHSAQIVHMCQAFVNAGAEVDLYVNHRVTGSLDEIGKYYEILPNFSLRRLSHGIFNPAIKITFYVSELFFTVHFLPKKPAYDYVYSRSEWIIWFLSFFISADKLMWESHEAKQNYPARRIINKGIKMVVISEGIRDVYQSSLKSQNQLLVAHDGIDESFYEPVESKEEARVRLGIDINKKVAMYIGGFDAWKGIDTFCLSSDYTDVSLVVIGGSTEEVNKYKTIYPKVKFLGQKPYSELKNNQQAADILVIPNSSREKVSSSYTSPLKLFAHMSSGIPIVAADVPSVKNVSNQVTFFAPDNPKSLAKALDDVFANYEGKCTLALRIREITRKYLWIERAKQIIKYIQMHG